MKILLPLACVLAPCLSAQSSTSLRQPDAAQVEVQRGRIVVLHDGRAERTMRSGESEIAKGDTHIEIGTGSEVRLTWPGRASLRGGP